nr:DUF29 domain-containing protein [Thioflavicoccus mobilis]
MNAPSLRVEAHVRDLPRRRQSQRGGEQPVLCGHGEPLLLQDDRPQHLGVASAPGSSRNPPVTHTIRERALSIKEQRIRLAAHLDDNPSLKSKLDEAIDQAYRLALIETERETGLPESMFPITCPFEFSQMMDEAFWPDGE